MSSAPLLDVANLAPGDAIRVDGEWLDVFDVRRIEDRIYVTTDDDRTFVAAFGARRRIRKAAPTAPRVLP